MKEKILELFEKAAEQQVIFRPFVSDDELSDLAEDIVELCNLQNVNGSALKKTIKKAIKKNCDGTHTSYLSEWSLGTGIAELFDDICKKVDKHCR